MSRTLLFLLVAMTVTVTACSGSSTDVPTTAARPLTLPLPASDAPYTATVFGDITARQIGLALANVPDSPFTVTDQTRIDLGPFTGDNIDVTYLESWASAATGSDVVVFAVDLSSDEVSCRTDLDAPLAGEATSAVDFWSCIDEARTRRYGEVFTQLAAALKPIEVPIVAVLAPSTTETATLLQMSSLPDDVAERAINRLPVVAALETDFNLWMAVELADIGVDLVINPLEFGFDRYRPLEEIEPGVTVKTRPTLDHRGYCPWGSAKLVSETGSQLVEGFEPSLDFNWVNETWTSVPAFFTVRNHVQVAINGQDSTTNLVENCLVTPIDDPAAAAAFGLYVPTPIR